jgi:membrane peptidoglycan carboxypeptidase
VRKIKLHDDTVFKAHSKSTALFSSNTCKQLHRGLEAAMTEGTGAKAARGIRPKVPLAGKTGTTDNGRDAWFVGYTREVTLVVWFGRDSNRPISSDASGGNVAAPTAVNIFDALDRLYRLTAPTF